MSKLTDQTHASEKVVLSAPMSFSGSAKRLWRIKRKADGRALVTRATLTSVAVVLIAVAWIVVTAWYAVILVLPPAWLFVGYRLVRRSMRRDRAYAARHRELLKIKDVDRVEQAS